MNHLLSRSAATFCASVALATTNIFAATLIVTSTADSGPGTLRQAIADANPDGGDVIVFNLPNGSTITLAAELVIDKALSISGPGMDGLTISGDNAVRVFNVTAASPRVVSFSGFTVGGARVTDDANGAGIQSLQGTTINVTGCRLRDNLTSLSSGSGRRGGGIYSVGGSLNITSCVFLDNAARSGSGIYITGGTLVVDGSSFFRNGTRPTHPFPPASSALGGAVLASAGSSYFNRCNFFLNRVEGMGGGIYSINGAMTVTDSVVETNEANSGAGIAVSGGTLTVSGCFFASNGQFRPVSSGAGLWSGIVSTAIPPGTVNITNSTFVDNGAFNGAGAIQNDAGCTLNVTNSTISANYGSSGASGGITSAPESTTRTANTIVARNTGGPDPDVRGHFVTLGHNLIGNSQGSTGFTHSTNGDKVGSAAAPIDPRLAFAANNGGPTVTMALLADSPAINMGNDALAPPTDQRGYSRSGISDIGAYEFNGAPPVPLQIVASTKLHSSVPYEIVLPADSRAVECRSGGATNAHTIVFRFVNTLTSVGGVTLSGTGTVSSSGIGSDAREYVVNLAGVANAQVITVTLTNVTDSAGNNSAAVARRMGMLLGDVGGNGAVSASDVGQVKAQAGQAVSGANFRSDVISNNAVNATDIGAVKSVAGTQLPAAPGLPTSPDSH